MSDISFLNQLGDAIDLATARPVKRSQRLRRTRSTRASLALVALILLSGGVALASGLLASNSPIGLASAGPMCFTSASLQDGSGPSNNELLPVPACAQTRRLLGQPARPLVACVSEGAPNSYSGVAVFPGSGPDACKHTGLKSLPVGYLAALSRVAALQANLAKLDNAGCVPPARLAEQVQEMLTHDGWVGWHTALHTDPNGPCSSVAGDTTGRGTSLHGSIYAPDRQVDVFAEPYPATLKLLHSRGAESLLAATGRRCYDQTAIPQLVRRWLGTSSRTVHYEASSTQLPTGTGLNDGRQLQLAAGCAVIADIHSSPDGYNLVVDIWRGSGRPR